MFYTLINEAAHVPSIFAVVSVYVSIVILMIGVSNA